ncbi:hypothetical protein Taro_053715 [Colocasia esculenta]|uniref:BURP domain-containing protein n=1 Tax=Colocasia esculenta TaxID=4460 RepID=A0A843XNG4_COLES|nr:hypothetical protein [Colocasia esculenta]
MDRPVFALLVLALFVAVVNAHYTLPEDYWKKVLPNTPMPGIVRDLLHPDANIKAEKKAYYKEQAGKGISVTRDDIHIYHSAANLEEVRNDPRAALLFLEKDLHPGAKMKLRFIKSSPPAAFIPRAVADALPFSSGKLPEILARFSVKPDSIEAEQVRQMLKMCEDVSASGGEAQHCATSLESMVDFAASSLGTHNVRAVSTEAFKEEDAQKKQQYYTVPASGMEILATGGKVVVCHVEPYPYAVLYCHMSASSTKAYVVPLVGEDGSKVAAGAVCHMNTSTWNPGHVAFKLLDVKPGTPICHFLLQDNVIWVPSN